MCETETIYKKKKNVVTLKSPSGSNHFYLCAFFQSSMQNSPDGISKFEEDGLG